MNWTVGSKLGLGFGVALIIFLVVGSTAYNNLAQQAAAASWVVHTHEVQKQIAQFMSSVQDIEGDQRNYIITGDNNYLDLYTHAIAAAETNRKELTRLVADNPRELAKSESLGTLLNDKLALLQESIDLRKTHDLPAAQSTIASGRGKRAMDAIQNTAQDMYAEEGRLLKLRNDVAANDTRSAKLTIAIGTLLAIFFAGIAGIVITRDISRPLGRLTLTAEAIASGDLSTPPLGIKRRDEVGLLAISFDRMGQYLRSMATAAEQIAAGDLKVNIQPQSPQDQLGVAFARMVANLRQQISGLAEGIQVLGSSASEIVASTAQLASGASESAVAVSETTTTVEEIRQTARLASQKAKAVSDSAQKAAHISDTGRKSTRDVVSGMERINSQMEAIAQSMMRLSEQSHAIGQIVATVEDLSAQSNLLAVNAAIEAAKAGEYGKGFSVVAQEVKSLAEQSRHATDRVRAILDEIQKATTAAVMATEQGGKAVEAGTRHTEAAGDSIGALTGSVTEAAQAATQIAASSQQQLMGMDQVAGAMESIKQASTQNAASARQLENAARNINEMGQRLKSMVASYAV